MHLDYKKYKRIFAFGCSFTQHTYPTWVYLIKSEAPTAEFYNLADGGTGNIFISVRIAEANAKFKFTDTDLILVMFTTFPREDRWVGNKWLAYGNIYNQPIYDDEWVRKFADLIGYMIRDLGIISTTKGYVESLSSDSLLLTSTPFFDYPDRLIPNAQKQVANRIIETYTPLSNSFPISVKEVLSENNNWPVGHSYYRTSDSTELFDDTHPNPAMYLQYLKHIGLNLTELSEKYVNDAMLRLQSMKFSDQCYDIFPEISQAREFSCMHMF